MYIQSRGNDYKAGPAAQTKFFLELILFLEWFGFLTLEVIGLAGSKCMALLQDEHLIL